MDSATVFESDIGGTTYLHKTPDGNKRNKYWVAACDSDHCVLINKEPAILPPFLPLTQSVMCAKGGARSTRHLGKRGWG